MFSVDVIQSLDFELFNFEHNYFIGQLVNSLARDQVSNPTYPKHQMVFWPNSKEELSWSEYIYIYIISYVHSMPCIKKTHLQKMGLIEFDQPDLMVLENPIFMVGGYGF